MLLTLTLVSLLHAAPTADTLAGAWQIKGDVAGNPLNEVCTIKQTGTALSGTCTRETDAPQPLTGEVKDGKVTFKHGGDYQGQELTITYTGTLASPKELKGTVDVQPFGVSGDFTATPAPATPAAPAKP
jgi:hypothetical protein